MERRGDAVMKRSKSKKRGKAYLDIIKKSRKRAMEAPILVRRRVAPMEY